MHGWQIEKGLDIRRGAPNHSNYFQKYCPWLYLLVEFHDQMIYDSKDIFKKCTLNILYISCANTHNDVATFKLDIILQIQKKKKNISKM